jgi:hypothetical protein
MADSLDRARSAVVDFGMSLKGSVQEHLSPSRMQHQSPEEQWFGPDGQMGLGKKSSIEGQTGDTTRPIIVNVTVGRHEFRDIVTEIIDEGQMVNRNRFGNTFS